MDQQCHWCKGNGRKKSRKIRIFEKVVGKLPLNYWAILELLCFYLYTRTILCIFLLSSSEARETLWRIKGTDKGEVSRKPFLHTSLPYLSLWSENLLNSSRDHFYSHLKWRNYAAKRLYILHKVSNCAGKWQSCGWIQDSLTLKLVIFTTPIIA